MFNHNRAITKTRKPHNCVWCGEHIPVGSPTQFHSGTFEGDFYSGHMHPECHRAWADAPYDLHGEGFCPGDFKRGTTESTQ